MIVTLAIDPGIRSPGAAAFINGQLVAATRIKVPATVHKMTHTGDRVWTVARLIHAWWTGALPVASRLGSTFDLVYEWPQIYRTSRSKGDPNNLLKTLAVGAAASALVAADHVFTPTPHDWAGNTTKETSGDPWVSQRAKMVLRRLRPGERELIPDSHDAIDAVALGMWRVGRFEQHCVYPGASPG